MHSKETLNVFISDTILDAMGKKKITALVLLDFSKAFDSIDKLINKLRSLGVSKKAADWSTSQARVFIHPRTTAKTLVAAGHVNPRF